MLKVSKLMEDQQIYRSPNAPENPAISVILPIYCHNGVMLKRAIESVLEQTFQNFELIIVDDGSRDGSYETAMEYAARDSRIVVIRHELNCGLPALRVNEGILTARGTYIAYQFDDDEYLPNCLKDLYEEIQHHDAPCVVYGKAELILIDSTGDKTTRLLGDTFNYALLCNSNQIGNNTVLHDKSIFEESGMYDPHIVMRRFSDYDLWRRMGKYVPFYHLPKKVSVVHAGQPGSLGASVPLRSLPLLRRFLEIDREAKLTPERIEQYSVSDLSPYIFNFSSDENEWLYRHEILPFLNRATYYMTNAQKQVYAIVRNQIKHLVVFKSDYSTSVDVTIKNFLQRSTGIPYTFSFSKASDASAFYNHFCDLNIFYRSISNTERALLNKTSSIASAYWIDDNMFRFHEDGDTFAYLAPGTDNYKNLEYMVEHCDEVISYNPMISEDCSRYNPHIFELSTNIPSQYLLEKTSPEDGRIHFAVFSGNVRQEIFAELWAALEKLTKRYADRIDITFWGLDPSQYAPLTCPVYHQPFTHSYDRYLDNLRNAFFHFQICPLGVRKTDRSKSPVKYLEGTAAGAVCLFSNEQPYDMLPEDCCIKVENTVDDWYQALCTAVEMPEDARLTIYRQAYAHIQQKYTTESQAVSFISALESAQLHHHLQGKAICYMIHEAYLGGATLHLFRHAMLMKSLHFKVIFCLQDSYAHVPDFEEYAQKRGVDTVHYLHCRKSVEPVPSTAEDHTDAVKIAEFLQQQDVGMIHAATYFPALGLAAQMLGIPNVATLHQYYPNPKGYENDSNIQMIHSSSNRYANEWEQIFKTPANRIVCPVDDAFFRHYPANVEQTMEKLGSGQTLHILVSGTLQPRKNQLEAIRAAGLLRDHGYSVRMSLIGYDTLVPNYVQECRDEIIQQGLEDIVQIKGFEHEPEIYYDGTSENSCQILLCSAENESMPQTILQAMAAGVFVVSTNCGGVAEIIKDNYNGVMTTGVDAASLADGIERILSREPEVQRAILQNAQDTIRSIATPEFVRSELLYLYLRAFERLPLRVTVVEKSAEVQADLTAIPSVTMLQAKREHHEFPTMTEENYCVSMGGRNLAKRRRNYQIMMRMGSLTGLQFSAATLGGHSRGTLRARLYLGRVLLQTADFYMDGTVQKQIDWRFPAIQAPSGTFLTLQLQYLPAQPGEWLCVYEKRKPLTFLNRILYKLNLPCSYVLDGIGIFE